MNDREKNLVWCCILVFVLTLMAMGAGGCASDHQILRYNSPINMAENVIPGIEPEESARKIMIVVRGKGIEPEEGTPMQKKFLAERAAVLDGYRKLSERLAGFLINGQTNSGSNMLSMDEVMLETRSYMRGAQIGPVTYQDGFAVVDVKIFIQPRQSVFLTRPLAFN